MNKSIEIITPSKLDSQIISKIKEGLDKNGEVIQIIDQKVKGGIAIRYDGRLYSLSLNTKLKELKTEANKLLKEEGLDSAQMLSQLKDKISEINFEVEISEVGEVMEVKDGAALVSGLSMCMSQELLQFENGVLGFALDLGEEYIGVMILGRSKLVQSGMSVKRLHRVVSVPVTEKLIGRVVDSLFNPIDGKEEIVTDTFWEVERIAPGVMDRQPVKQPLLTGIKAIDALVPIGLGQRELILGDRQSGKTTIAIDTILNQKDQNMICIYVAIGQKESKVARIVTTLEERGAMEYTVVVNSSASSEASLQYLAPYSAVTLAEYFAYQGKNVLIIYDDLSKHAVAYREISLLLKRPPGREAYPGDVFYLHSRLLERAFKLNEKLGAGSVTALPIIETQANDISAYIPTNVISITDGQIFLESDLFNKGIRPAINVGASVSRVGSSAQTKPMKKSAGGLKLGLAQFRDFEAFAQFATDLDQKTKNEIDRGKRLIEILKQKPYSPLSVQYEVAIIYAVEKGHFNEIQIEKLEEAETKFYQYLDLHGATLLQSLSNGEWDEAIENELIKHSVDFAQKFISSNN